MTTTSRVVSGSTVLPSSSPLEKTKTSAGIEALNKRVAKVWKAIKNDASAFVKKVEGFLQASDRKLLMLESKLRELALDQRESHLRAKIQKVSDLYKATVDDLESSQDLLEEATEYLETHAQFFWTSIATQEKIVIEAWDALDRHQTAVLLGESERSPGLENTLQSSFQQLQSTFGREKKVGLEALQALRNIQQKQRKQFDAIQLKISNLDEKLKRLEENLENVGESQLIVGEQRIKLLKESSQQGKANPEELFDKYSHVLRDYNAR